MRKFSSRASFFPLSVLLPQVREATASISQPLRFLRKTARLRAPHRTPLPLSRTSGRPCSHRGFCPSPAMPPWQLCKPGCLRTGAARSRSDSSNCQHQDSPSPCTNTKPELPHLTHTRRPRLQLQGTEKGRTGRRWPGTHECR